MASIFTKIVNGKIPCYKIYEDDKVLAFLDINPEAKGHTLVIPKIEVDKLYDLDDETYAHLMSVVKKLAKNMDEKLGTRTLIKVIGVDVPHAHVHLIPYSEHFMDPEHHENLSEAEFKEVQNLLSA
jgi:histidine triad (HIT) family protein